MTIRKCPVIDKRITFDKSWASRENYSYLPLKMQRVQTKWTATGKGAKKKGELDKRIYAGKSRINAFKLILPPYHFHQPIPLCDWREMPPVLPNGTNVCFDGFLWFSPSTCLPIRLRPGGKVSPCFVAPPQAAQLVVFVGGPQKNHQNSHLCLATFEPL